jgi:hypothetical protein
MSSISKQGGGRRREEETDKTEVACCKISKRKHQVKETWNYSKEYQRRKRLKDFK